MRGKFILVNILITLLFTCSLTGAINTYDDTNEKIKTDNFFLLETKNSGEGGWHPEISLSQYGKGLSDIYRIGGGDGGWEYPYDGNGVHMWAELNRIRAEYTFDIEDGPVNYVRYEIEYKDKWPTSDGPDALIYKWDDTWDSLSNIGGGGSYNPFYTWKEHTFDLNPDLYVNDDAQIRVAAQAFDDSSIWHQDDFGVKTMKISFQTADEEIFETIVLTNDSDNDGGDDLVKMKIDADVGDYGDGTTVEVTANCELIDPEQNIIDSDSVTWIITDHQVEYGYVNLSADGGINGEYTINIVLIDEHGNNECTTEKTVDLEPDPQRIINFETTEGGEIDFEGKIYINGDVTMVTDGIYSIEALSFEYYVFNVWNCSGGVNISAENINNPSTTVEITGNGTIKANFVYTLNTVYFFIYPELGGIINLAGYYFENNTGCLISDGTYPITAIASEPDYYFYNWTVYGDVVIEDLFAVETQATFSGDSIIIATFIENQPPDIPEDINGPSFGVINVDYTFSTSTIDPDGGDIYYKFDWGDGTFSDWIGPYSSGETIDVKHKWAGPREYQIKVKAKDNSDLESDWSDPFTIKIHSKPNAPTISGPLKGNIDTEYEYTFVSTDLDDDELYYYIEWGDGTTEDWIGPYSSGEEFKLNHVWKKQNIYTIRAMVKDENEITSDWGTLTISMPRYKIFQNIYNIFLSKIYQQYPMILKAILQILIKN